MGLRSTFKNMFDQAAQPAIEPAPAAPQVAASITPGSRVHHEYFTADAPDADGKWSWHARVYADNGAVNEQGGQADTHELARNAALTWCARIKVQLGGEA